MDASACVQHKAGLGPISLHAHERLALQHPSFDLLYYVYNTLQPVRDRGSERCMTRIDKGPSPSPPPYSRQAPFPPPTSLASLLFGGAGAVSSPASFSPCSSDTDHNIELSEYTYNSEYWSVDVIFGTLGGGKKEVERDPWGAKAVI